MTSKYGKDAGETRWRRSSSCGRALGVIILIGTQIPDKDSLPTGITRNVNTRFCLSRRGPDANDMILGTSAYKHGLPGDRVRAGHRGRVGHPARLRAEARRCGRSTSTPPPPADRRPRRRAARRRPAPCPKPDEQTRDIAPAADVLGDLAACGRATRRRRGTRRCCGLLAELRPEVYGGWEAAQLTTALKPHPAIKAATDRAAGSTASPSTGAASSTPTSLAAIAERDRKRAAG